MKLACFPSPDGQKIAYTDSDGSLYVAKLGAHPAAPNVQLVKCGRRGIGTAFSWNKPFRDLVWSNSSELLAYTMQADNSHSQVYIMHISNRALSYAVSTERVNSWSPTWSPDSRWLFFLSDRRFEHEQDVFDFRAGQPSAQDSVGVYAVSMDTEAHPVWRVEHELQHQAAVGPALLDLPGAGGRLVQLPIPLGRWKRADTLCGFRICLWCVHCSHQRACRTLQPAGREP